jgi:hypothetical protein
MSTVQFSQLKKINDLLKEADLLQAQVAKLEEEIVTISDHYQNESKRYKSKLEVEYKQHMQLEKIEVEINELKETEYLLITKLFKVIEASLDHYFQRGGYKDFVTALLKILDQGKSKYSIHTNKANSHFLPEDAKIDSDKGFFIETEFTELVLDPEQLKPLLRESLLKVKVPQSLKS